MPTPFLFLAVYLAGSIVCAVLIDAPTDAGWALTWRYLAVPIGVLVIAVVYRSRSRPGDRGTRPWRTWLMAGALYGAVMLATPSYLLMVNSLGAAGPPVTVAGPVLDKWTHTYKTTGHYVQVLDGQTGTGLTIQLSSADYAAVQVGSRFSRTFSRGRLGLLYRWTVE